MQDLYVRPRKRGLATMPAANRLDSGVLRAMFDEWENANRLPNYFYRLKMALRAYKGSQAELIKNRAA